MRQKYQLTIRELFFVDDFINNRFSRYPRLKVSLEFDDPRKRQLNEAHKAASTKVPE